MISCTISRNWNLFQKKIKTGLFKSHPVLELERRLSLLKWGRYWERCSQMNYFPLTLGFESVDSNDLEWFSVVNFFAQIILTFCRYYWTLNKTSLLRSRMVARHVVICIKMLIQPSMPREINCELQEIFKVTENINRKTPLVCNCPLNITPIISKVQKWNVQRLAFEVFTWALVLQITVPHWQSHLWLASCETLLWLPALEEGTLVYIWPPRLLSTTTPVAGRGGRAGPKFLLIKEIRGRDLGHHATPALGPLALLACYLLPQPLPTTPKPHPSLVKKPFGVAMPARPPGRTGCADEQRNIADRPLSLLSLSLSLGVLDSELGGSAPPCCWFRQRWSSFEFWVVTSISRGMLESWRPLAIMERGWNQAQSTGLGGDRCRQAINETRITSHPNPLYTVAHNREKETIFGASLLSNKKPPTLHNGGYSRFKTVVL